MTLIFRNFVSIKIIKTFLNENYKTYSKFTSNCNYFYKL